MGTRLSALTRLPPAPLSPEPTYARQIERLPATLKAAKKAALAATVASELPSEIKDVSTVRAELVRIARQPRRAF